VKYVQPYGITDPEASYINGDPSIGRQGSIPPAAAFENPMRELVHIITDSLLVPSDSDLEQCAKGIRSQRMNYVEDTGSANNLSVALTPPLAAYSLGLVLRVKVHTANTGAATIDAGAGRVPIRKPNGGEVASGDLPAAGLIELVYDGTVFQMINFGGAGSGGPGTIFQINIPYTVDTSGVANTVIANFSPAITSLTAGVIVMVKIANTNTSNSNININGLGNVPIKAQGGHASWPLLPNDIAAGDVVVLIYDGTSFWIYPNSAINIASLFNVTTVAQIDSLFAALGRKRISTTGTVRILMAAGTYGPAFGAFGNAVITAFHPDSDRITVEGTMVAGQSPPTTANFQRSGSSSSARAADSAFNISMLRAKYATEVQIGSVAGAAMQHVGPGKITFKNILVTGPNTTVSGQRGFSADASALFCVGCTAWGIGDTGYAVTSGRIDTQDSHASGCASRGFVAGGGSTMGLSGGGAYGCGTNGVEASTGSAIVTTPTDLATSPPNGTLPFGFSSQCNGSYGTYAQSSNIYVARGTIILNAIQDMVANNMGISAQFMSSVTTMSPAAGTVGNLNSISINYG